MRLSHLALSALLLAAPAVAQVPGASPGAGYELLDGTWFRLENGRRYRVDPEVLSVHFRAPVRSVADLLERDADLGLREQIAALTAVRSNKLGVHDLRLAEGADLWAVLAALRASRYVTFAEETTHGSWESIPNDPEFASQWHHRNIGQVGGKIDADIDSDLAWNWTAGVSTVVVAILDSGTQISHPDLAANTWFNPGEIPGNGLDDDSNGFVDDVNGWDFGNGNNNVEGPVFHGTFVAGMVGADTNNGIGVAGIAGGFGVAGDGARLMIGGVGDAAPIAAVLDDALIYAADNGAHSINLSLTVAQSSAIDMALAYARNTVGVPVFCASGNSFGAITYPANSVDVFAIGATNSSDVRAGFSNFGSGLWMVAPGDSVRSTTTGSSYATNSGTSFSSPLCAGAAALLLSILPTLDPDEIGEILKLTADDINTPGFDAQTGWGRLNADAAVQHVLASDCNGNGIYDPRDIALGTSADANFNGVPDECEILTYCTAKTNSLGCVPAIGFGGFPSATSTFGFMVECTQVRNKKSGLLFYTVNGARASSPFQCGTLCVGPSGIQRTPARNSGGNAMGDDCSGKFLIDMNAFSAGLAGGNPQAALLIPGTVVHAQWWGRDQGFMPPCNTTLSDALEYSVGS